LYLIYHCKIVTCTLWLASKIGFDGFKLINNITTIELDCQKSNIIGNWLKHRLYTIICISFPNDWPNNLFIGAFSIIDTLIHQTTDVFLNTRAIKKNLKWHKPSKILAITLAKSPSGHYRIVLWRKHWRPDE